VAEIAEHGGAAEGCDAADYGNCDERGRAGGCISADGPEGHGSVLASGM